MDEESQQLERVRLAIASASVTGCLEWIDDATQIRVKNDPALEGLTLKEIRNALVRWSQADGRIERRRETRSEYQPRREYWFWVLVPVAGFVQPLFYELELTDDDPDCPAVSILNVHL